MSPLPTHHAQDLAPEIVDQILSHLVELCRRERPPRKGEEPQAAEDSDPRRSRRLTGLSSASLISKIWRGPAQRLLVKLLVIRSGFEARRIRDGLVASGGLGEHVRELKQRHEDNSVTEEYLADLLRLLPGLRKLALKHVGFTSFRGDGWEPNITLGNLKTLEVASAPFDATLDLTRSLLRLTPNLETLILNSTRSSPIEVELQGLLSPPMTIPTLHTLISKGNNYGSLLPTLLSSETLSSITTLCLEGVRSDWEIIAVLKLVPNVTKVVHRSQVDNNTLAAIYTHLPRLREAGFYRLHDAALPGVPETIDTLSFLSSSSAYIALNSFGGHAKWPSALRRVKIQHPVWSSHFGTLSAQIRLREICERHKLELVVVELGF